jgi:long-chain acyl-CoA synthetase
MAAARRVDRGVETAPHVRRQPLCTTPGPGGPSSWPATGETVSYAEHEQRTNRLAHLLRAEGLKRLDHYAIFMENNNRYLECNGAGERSGQYYTCINSYLTPDEVAYIVDNSESQLLITSLAKLPCAQAALAKCPRVKRCLVVDGGARGACNERPTLRRFRGRTQATPARRLLTSGSARAMLYSSGTTGRPKGILRPAAREPHRNRCRCSTSEQPVAMQETACVTSRQRRCTTRRRRPTWH